jgi:hypothetical protein
VEVFLTFLPLIFWMIVFAVIIRIGMSKFKKSLNKDLERRVEQLEKDNLLLKSNTND